MCVCDITARSFFSLYYVYHYYCYYSIKTGRAYDFYTLSGAKISPGRGMISIHTGAVSSSCIIYNVFSVGI